MIKVMIGMMAALYAAAYMFEPMATERVAVTSESVMCLAAGEPLFASDFGKCGERTQ